MVDTPSRISGRVLRTPIVLHPSLGNTGDGDTFGPDRHVHAQVKARTAITSDVAGATLTAWAIVRIRPSVQLDVGDEQRRAPAPGDEATIWGVRRRIASVEPVAGLGTAVAFLELTAGDGSGNGYAGGST